MAGEIKLPELGEGIDKAQVLSVLVSPGDTVRKDQTVIEVETEKATAEVPAEVAGVVDEIKVKEGDEIKVGQVLVTLNLSEEPAAESKDDDAEDEDQDEAESKKPAKKSKSKSKTKSKKAEKKPEPEEDEDDGEDSDPEDGDAGEDAEPEEDEGDKGGAREKILYLDEAETDSQTPAPAAPSVRRLARELGVPINRVKGSGPGGRVSEDDVKAFTRNLIHRSASAPAQGASDSEAPPAPGKQPPLPDFTQWGDVERKPMSMVRKATAQAMKTSWATVPMVTQFDRADITELEDFRKTYSKQTGDKITMTAVAAKVLASALRVFPQFNTSLDMESGDVIYKQYVHLGVAVDTDRGLLVPVLRDADSKNIRTLAQELGDAAEKARSGKVSLEELRGATCTVTNLGGLGTTYFSPIVNWPEVAILGMGRASVEAVHDNGEFAPRLILPLAVTYDHRIIDGADAARFLRWIARTLEDPILLAVEG